MRWKACVVVLLAAVLVMLPSVASAQATKTAAKAPPPKKATHAATATPVKAGAADQVLPPSLPADLAPLGPAADSPAPVALPPAAKAVAPRAAAAKSAATRTAAPMADLADKGGLPGLPPEGPAAKKVFPYMGYISADAVNIRSGPGSFYYVLAMLKKDDRVTVESEEDGWLALRPLPGVFGMMHKGDVALAADSKSATVAAPAARVYAASAAAKRHWCVMAVIKQGDPVKVLAVEGDMVRVVPPDGSHVYVVNEFVTAGASNASAAESAISRLEVKPPEADPMVDEFNKADASLQAELAKPIGERHYEDMYAKYRELGDKSDKGYLKQAAAQRIAYLNSLREQQADYLKVAGLGTTLDQTLADIKARQVAAETEKAIEKRAAKPEFLATGLVAKMESLADVDYPIKFKLVDQQGRPVVVLSSTAYDLNKYIGKVVGVRGTKTYLKDWRIYLITVDEIEVAE